METVETGNKNRCVTEATHVLLRKPIGKNNKCDFRAFPELRSVHEFYHLKEFFNNFGTSEPFTG